MHLIAHGETFLLKLKLETIRREKRNQEEMGAYLRVLLQVGETSVSQTVAVVPAGKG
jgi:hypothetical protein